MAAEQRVVESARCIQRFLRGVCWSFSGKNLIKRLIRYGLNFCEFESIPMTYERWSKDVQRSWVIRDLHLLLYRVLERILKHYGGKINSMLVKPKYVLASLMLVQGVQGVFGEHFQVLREASLSMLKSMRVIFFRVLEHGISGIRKIEWVVWKNFAREVGEFHKKFDGWRELDVLTFVKDLKRRLIALHRHCRVVGWDVESIVQDAELRTKLKRIGGEEALKEVGEHIEGFWRIVYSTQNLE
eukprot:144936-Hanusia_phi.AAC.5